MVSRSVTDASRRQGGGFTLVEAVVLIVILGILGAVSAPRFLALQELAAVRAHRQALGDLRQAQRLAADSGCPVQVDFDPTGYRLRQRSGCRTGSFDLEVVDPVAQQAPQVVVLPDGVTLTSTVDPIVFDALGRLTTSDGTTTDVVVQIGDRTLAGVGETGLVRVP